MLYVIMADGNGVRWGEYNGTPKHLIKVYGETLLERTVRLLKSVDEEAQIVITSHDERYEVEGATRYEPKHNELEIDRFTDELISDEVCFLYGDVYYLRYTLEKIANKDLGPITFFGNQASILAIKVFDGALFREHINHVREAIAQGKIEDGRGWNVYQSYTGQEIGDAKEPGEYFMNVGTRSFDINTPEEYEKHFPGKTKETRSTGKKKKKKRKKLWKVARRKLHIAETVIEYRRKGYPYLVSKQWGRMVHRDLVRKNGFTKAEKKIIHEKGFMTYSVKKYGLTPENYTQYWTDFENLRSKPINNAYTKWLTDRLTPSLIMKPLKYTPKVYFNIIRRDRKNVIIDLEHGTVATVKDVIRTVNEKGPLTLNPSEVKYALQTYLLESLNGEEDRILLSGEPYSEEELEKLIKGLGRYFVIREYKESAPEVAELFHTNQVVFGFLMGNAPNEPPRILRSVVESRMPLIGGNMTSARSQNYKMSRLPVDTETGWVEGEFRNEEIAGTVPRWEELCQAAKDVASYISEVTYFEVFFRLPAGDPLAIAFGATPIVRGWEDNSSEHVKFLRERLEKKESVKRTNQGPSFKASMKKRALRFARRHYFRKGFREFMLATWLLAVKDDFQNTKSTTLPQKVWAWKRGFLSFRINQYGLTEDNWKSILSDYDYAWLNRINNSYQKWINDKLTMRYILNDLKQYLPEYYYFVENRYGTMKIKGLQDLPAGTEESSEGVVELLKQKGKLVFKPNAGTHGDGFYKFEYIDDKIFINGEEEGPEGVDRVLRSQKSTYIVTDYLEMHPELKKIYPQSVNTVRIMVINETCGDPKIMQTYMRVGSSKTGITDNIAYGGFAVYVDKETGHYDRAALLADHVYTPMDRHPDTGVLMVGDLPNWEIVKKGVIDIARHIPQMEYMGYDVVITEEGFKILEINIHQDIHKAHEFTPEINAYFDKVKARKAGKRLPNQTVPEEANRNEEAIMAAEVAGAEAAAAEESQEDAAPSEAQ